MSYIQNRKHFELYFPFNKKTREKRNQFKTQKIRMDGMFFTSFFIKMGLERCLTAEYIYLDNIK